MQQNRVIHRLIDLYPDARKINGVIKRQNGLKTLFEGLRVKVTMKKLRVKVSSVHQKTYFPIKRYMWRCSNVRKANYLSVTFTLNPFSSNQTEQNISKHCLTIFICITSNKLHTPAIMYKNIIANII